MTFDLNRNELESLNTQLHDLNIDPLKLGTPQNFEMLLQCLAFVLEDRISKRESFMRSEKLNLEMERVHTILTQHSTPESCRDQARNPASLTQLEDLLINAKALIDRVESLGVKVPGSLAIVDLDMQRLKAGAR